jgi:hypothetical protein
MDGEWDQYIWKFHVVKKTEGWYWKLEKPDGTITAASEQVFATSWGAKQSARELQERIGRARIIDPQ